METKKRERRVSEVERMMASHKEDSVTAAGYHDTPQRSISVCTMLTAFEERQRQYALSHGFIGSERDFSRQDRKKSFDSRRRLTNSDSDLSHLQKQHSNQRRKSRTSKTKKSEMPLWQQKAMEEQVFEADETKAGD